MDQKYLNEEQYLKTNKKIKLVGVIIIIIGLALIGTGAYFVLQAAMVKTPKMAIDNNWFEVSRSKMTTGSLGLFLIMPGIFVTAVGCMVRFFIPNRRAIIAYQTQQVMPVAKEGIKDITPTLAESAADIAKEIKKNNY